MSPMEHAARFYRHELPDVIRDNYSISTPTLFCLYRVVAIHGPDPDTFWIEYFSGKMVELLEHIPFWLPYVAFQRRGRTKCHALATMVNKVVAHDPAKNGNADALSRGRARGREDQGAKTA